MVKHLQCSHLWLPYSRSYSLHQTLLSKPEGYGNSSPRRWARSPTQTLNSTATSSDGFEGNKQDARGARERKMSRVEELASTEIGFRDSEGLKPFHLAVFFIVLSAGLWFLAVLLYFTADIKLQQACLKVLRRLLKTVALRQVMGILSAMTFVRFGLEPLVKMLRKLFVAPGTWEKSSEYYILREVRAPLLCLDDWLP